MSETEEEIIIIDDSEAIEDSHATTDDLTEAPKSKKRFFIFGGIALLLLILIITLLFFVLKEDTTQEIALDTNLLEEKLQNKVQQELEPSKLENMIAKANYLYSNGSKEKALSLYENIAQYSEAISQYNLGVAQLKDKQYKTALSTFSQAIQNDEKRCVSAINAAVCALHLKDEESFRYYIDLAYAYLPYETNSPLYSYYYSLISYYKQDYLALLNSLKNTTSDAYPNVVKNLTAKVNALYENDYKAIEATEKHFESEDEFSLGLLYARVGNFPLAIQHLEEALVKNIQAVKAQLALGLIHLKVGNLSTASHQIKNITDMFPDEVYKYYPLKVLLKKSLFTPSEAQELYRKSILPSKNTIYQKIFAFSPYKIFNANKTISYIRKGNANIYIDNVKTAQEYLSSSASASNVNIGITKAIKKALKLHIREANSDLLALTKIQPKHSILHYNLALTYAQMGNLRKANEHFLRSYYLDAKNYLSGIYAVMSSQLIHKNSTKLRSILIDAINDDEEISQESELYKTLLFISDNNYVSAIDWLDKEYKQRPLYLVLDALIAQKVKQREKAKAATQKLTLLLPHEILPHLMYIDAHFAELNSKQYAVKVLNYLKEQAFTYDDLYYGPYITRYLYIQENLITGKLYYLRSQLKDILAVTSKNSFDIESSLALASLYDRAFEEAYTHYNHLIDERKVQDAYTLFLGAVAAIAADHHGNAIALLELAKLKDGSFHESRYALALLYLEIKNNEGAVIQLSKIEKDRFQSNYFDFMIDMKQLSVKKNNL